MASSATPNWTQEDQERSRSAFLRFDKDRNGTIDAHELRAALEGFGQRPSDEEIFIMCVGRLRRGPRAAPKTSPRSRPYPRSSPSPPPPPKPLRGQDCRGGRGRQWRGGLFRVCARAAGAEGARGGAEQRERHGCVARAAPSARVRRCTLLPPALSQFLTPSPRATARLSSAVDAFIACGGQPDKSGFVERDRLVRIVKEDFGLMCVARLGCPSIAP